MEGSLLVFQSSIQPHNPIRETLSPIIHGIPILTTMLIANAYPSFPNREGSNLQNMLPLVKCGFLCMASGNQT